MTHSPGTHSSEAAELFWASLADALGVGTRDTFTALLTDDVRWGGEHGGNECTNRTEAGDHYDKLLDAGLTLRVLEVRAQPAGADQAGTQPDGGSEQARGYLVKLAVASSDPDDFPPELTVRLTMRGDLITDIRELDPPPTIELLYFDGCPNHDAYLPHLERMLAEHGINQPVQLTRIDTDEDARAHRFLGSPTLRIGGHDVDPTANTLGDDYALRCRLFQTPGGTAGTPPDLWVLDALLGNATHDTAAAAVRAGDLEALTVLLADHPELATIRLARHQGRTLLHVATDWPGHHPHVAATIAALVAAGADPDAPAQGEHAETPLHWAASNGDLDAINALLDAGANIDAPGAVIANGTPMADATAFGEWAAAELLLARGAATNLFEAAALGLVTRVEHLLGSGEVSAAPVTSSFWGACHGGHVDTAARLLDAGAEINWVGYDDLTPLDAARRADADELVTWLLQRGAKPATEVP